MSALTWQGPLYASFPFTGLSILRRCIYNVYVTQMERFPLIERSEALMITLLGMCYLQFE